MSLGTLTRRRLISGLLALPMASFLTGCLPRGSRTEAVRRLLEATLRALPLPEPLAVGQAYLAEASGEISMASLLGELQLPAFTTPDDFIATLEERFKKDFARRRTTSLDGWLVSQTEARLCAFLALAQTSTSARA